LTQAWTDPVSLNHFQAHRRVYFIRICASPRKAFTWKIGDPYFPTTSSTFAPALQTSSWE
jgi:hypothetical protein